MCHRKENLAQRYDLHQTAAAHGWRMRRAYHERIGRRQRRHHGAVLSRCRDGLRYVSGLPAERGPQIVLALIVGRKIVRQLGFEVRQGRLEAEITLVVRCRR